MGCSCSRWGQNRLSTGKAEVHQGVGKWALWQGWSTHNALVPANFLQRTFSGSGGGSPRSRPHPDVDSSGGENSGYRVQFTGSPLVSAKCALLLGASASEHSGAQRAMLAVSSFTSPPGGLQRGGFKVAFENCRE